MTTITEEAIEAVMVKIKPLDWTKIEDVYSADGGEIQITQWWQRGQIVAFEYNDIEFASFDEAKAAAQADYEARIRSALVAVPEQTDRYFAVDYTGCLYEWPDREAAIKAAEQFAETANGGEPVRTRAAALAAALVAPQAEGRDTGLREALLKLRSYNVDIAAGRINYRPEDHIAVVDRALSPKEPEPIWGKPLTFDEPPLGFNPHSGSEGGGWDEDDEPEYRGVMRENGE